MPESDSGSISQDLALAIAADSVDIVEDLLLSDRFNINSVDKRGHTPLTIACAYGRTGIVKHLLDKRAEVSKTIGNTGMTALHVAASNGYQDIVKILLQNGARREVRDMSGSTACDLAEVPPQPLFNQDISPRRLEDGDHQLISMRQACMIALGSSQ